MYAQLKFLFQLFNSYVPKNSCTELPFVLLNSCIKLNSTSLDHQFSSRWCLCALKSLYMRSTPSLRRFSNAAFETVPKSMGDDGPHSSFQGRPSSTSAFHATDGVMPLALCPQVLSTATCDSCFARQSTCSVISLYSSMSRAAHPQSFQRGMSTNDTFQPGLPFPLFVTS